jgi:hypothetical protein
MADSPAEPFHVAFQTLRERLQEGAYAPGARTTALDVAAALKAGQSKSLRRSSGLAGVDSGPGS